MGAQGSSLKEYAFWGYTGMGVMYAAQLGVFSDFSMKKFYGIDKIDKPHKGTSQWFGLAILNQQILTTFVKLNGGDINTLLKANAACAFGSVCLSVYQRDLFVTSEAILVNCVFIAGLLGAAMQ
mmetsp:Transcript_19519/g.31675  ORF Transcript_19519/g.31675 Transcript_19519/m.31675 type:complete len:124 (+) Transcript_19519:92-463(+)